MKIIETKLNEETAPLAHGYDVVCVFVNDDVNAEKMIQLQQQAIIQNNRPHYQHSTTTRYGNTYYTNSYSY